MNIFRRLRVNSSESANIRLSGRSEESLSTIHTRHTLEEHVVTGPIEACVRSQSNRR